MSLPTDAGEGTSHGKENQSSSSVTTSAIDEIFDRFKNYIDDRLDSFTSVRQDSSNKENDPDEEAKVFKRETEANKLKYKGNQKQYLFNAVLEDHNVFILDLLRKGENSKAMKALENVLALIQKRQKLIKLADKSEGGWLVVQEYEQEELADDSEDEKRIRKAQAQAVRKKKELSKSNKRPKLDRQQESHSNEDRQLFRGKLPLFTHAFFVYSRACLTHNKLPIL